LAPSFKNIRLRDFAPPSPPFFMSGGSFFQRINMPHGNHGGLAFRSQELLLVGLIRRIFCSSFNGEDSCPGTKPCDSIECGTNPRAQLSLVSGTFLGLPIKGYLGSSGSFDRRQVCLRVSQYAPLSAADAAPPFFARLSGLALSFFLQRFIPFGHPARPDQGLLDTLNGHPFPGTGIQSGLCRYLFATRL